MDGKKCTVIAAAVFLALSAGLSPATGAPAGEACSLLTQSEVSGALGASMAAGDSHGAPKACDWREPGGNKRVILAILTLNGFNVGKTPVQGNTNTPVSGIGDDAYYLERPHVATVLRVRRGDVAFSIDVKGSLSADQIKAIEKALAKDVLARL